MCKYWRHLVTITKHKFYVLKACYKTGILWQGITHDLSKYSIIEFFRSARFFQGDSSPINKEKQINGFSLSWLHHKGRNKHHWEYWVDFKEGKPIPVKMPNKYVKEMLCDWIGAGKAYNKGKWTVDSLKNWYSNSFYKMVLHKDTEDFIEFVISDSKTEEELYNNIEQGDNKNGKIY